jgi:hypothetical protein
MFLLYAPLGAMWPPFTAHLDRLGFAGWQIAAATATQALATMIGPVLAGQMADRWFRADRCLAAAAFLSAGLLLILGQCVRLDTIVSVTFAYWLLMAPIMTLGNVIAFAHLRQPEREYAGIRLWGTGGWIAAGWLRHSLASVLPYGIQPMLPDPFQLGAILTLVLGAYALTLPPTRPRTHAPDLFAPVAALRLLRRHDFAVYFGCSFLLGLTVPFETQNTALLLGQMGIDDDWKTPLMTVRQSMEMLTLGLLPWLMARLGLRLVVLVGAAALATTLAVETFCEAPAPVVGGLTVLGLFITCYVIAGQVFVNGRAGADIRASALALNSFTMALGMLLGYGLSGGVRTMADEALAPTFAVGAGIAAVAVLVLGAGFWPTAPADTAVQREP